MGGWGGRAELNTPEGVSAHEHVKTCRDASGGLGGVAPRGSTPHGSPARSCVATAVESDERLSGNARAVAGKAVTRFRSLAALPESSDAARALRAGPSEAKAGASASIASRKAAAGICKNAEEVRAEGKGKKQGARCKKKRRATMIDADDKCF